MKNSISFGDKKFYRIRLAFALKKGYYNFNYFISLNNRMIQYTKEEFNNEDELLRLHKQGIDSIFLKEEEFKRYLNLNLENKKKEKKNNLKDSLEDFIENKEYIKDFFVACGVEETKINLLYKNNDNVSKLIKNEKFLLKLYKEYNSEIDDIIKIKKEFLILTTTYILSKYNIITSDQILKVTTALTLEDILLNKDEIKNSRNNPKKLPEKILNHPVKILDHLPKHRDFQSDIIYNLLKYHHEKPDGSGYPFKIKFHRFDVFLATRYIAERYVDLLIESNFKTNKLPEIVEKINNEILQYKTTNFKKALELFNLAFKEDFTLG
jgi:hypothetical protein